MAQATYRPASALPGRRVPPQRYASKAAWRRAGGMFALTVLAILFLTPFVWIISTSLKSISDMSALPVQWLPSNPQWHNYFDAVTLIDYGRYAFNSIFLSTIFAVLTTLSSAFVGFGFARLRGKGKNPLFLVMLSTLMLPSVLTVIPTYILFARLGLIDTYWPWVLWGLASSPYLTFLYRQFFSSIPVELEEAAILDGCGYARIFWQIFLPLSKPVIATVAIFSFNAVWGDWLGPNLFLSSDNTTLAVAMSGGYIDQHSNSLPNILASGVVIYMLPVIVLFFFAQRYFIRGIVTSGLKG